ncbi:iron(III) transport system permease protein [Sphaerochaeta associata]|uniref:Iron ABC transporter permease n=1 Tax=Sphaerochaeta associata TaxID=1129264 RepID=A0ABY4D9Z9_9SPIR|nr:iron ABC transporter permease [Sphaerochaeta associata]UOM51113.1 iron ABC transporter permease [Sphaerochaeta associata]SMP65905.1 iron(III) transport system permease protein [Sphaerochaeta associata]
MQESQNALYNEDSGFKRYFKQLKFSLRDPVLLVSVISVTIIVAMFIVIPLFSILRESVEATGTFSLKSYSAIFRSSYDLEIIWNTIKLGLVVATLGTAVAFLFAYATTYLKIPNKRFFKVLSILPMISPPFVISLAAILLFGRSGLVSYKLFGVRNDIYGFWGLALTQVLSFFPIGYLMLTNLLQNIDPSVEEAAQALGSNQARVFMTVTIPLMLPGLANAALLIFIQSLADFGNAIVIGGNFTTMAVQIYQQGIGSYDMQGATALAVVLLMISVLAFYLQNSVIGKKSYITVTGKASKQRIMNANKKVTIPVYIICMAISVTVVSMYLLVPYGAFVRLWGVDFSFTTRWIKYVLTIGMRYIKDTTILAALATPISAIMGIVAAYLIVRKDFPGKKALEWSILMAIALPGTVLGLGYVLTYNTPPLILTGSGFILVVALVIRSMPIGTRSAIAALKQIDPSIEEAASICGAGSQKVFISVTIPLIRPVFFSGLVYSFIRGMTLVSTIIFLVSARWQMLTVAIMNQVDQGLYGAANAYCLVLIVIVGGVMLLMNLFIKTLGINLNEGY